MSTSKWTILFDVDRCNGCCNCVLSTLDEHVGNDHGAYSGEMPRHGASWFNVQAVERGVAPAVDVAYSPKTCVHCSDAPCVQAGGGAVRVRDDGIVIIDPVRARGRRDLVDTCPFGAIHWNEALQIPQHWTMDAHLLDAGWPEPRAAQACPTGALTVRRMTDREVAHLGEQGFSQSDEHRCVGSRLHVRASHRLTSSLVGGSICVRTGETSEPLVAAQVQLADATGTTAVATTNELGEFRFDNIGTLQGGITLTLVHEGSPRQWSFDEDPLHPGRYVVGTLSL